MNRHRKPGNAASGYQKRVVIKLRDDVQIPEQGPLDVILESEGILPWKELDAKVRIARVRHVFSALSKAELDALTMKPKKGDGWSTSVNLFNYLEVIPAEPRALEHLRSLALEIDDKVDHAYIASGPSSPPSFPGDNPLAGEQVHHRPALQGGIDTARAWSVPGGDGAGATFADVEQGWYLGHEDLSGVDVRQVFGLDLDFREHGCEVLGIVLGADNNRGIVGIAPRVRRSYALSEWSTREDFSTANAILAATKWLGRGGVILIESQLENRVPVELEEATWKAIHTATQNGFVVIEAAGNGAAHLDRLQNSAGAFSLVRNNDADPAERAFDSGAIIVGAGQPVKNAESYKLGRPQSSDTNFGSRVDCHAHGSGVETTGINPSYRSNFGGTSAASAIVAGVALCIQGIALARTGTPISPRLMRSILRAPGLGTPSVSPAEDLIRERPDLSRIVQYLLPNL